MRRLVQARPLLFYYAVAVGIATLVWLYITGLEIALADSQPNGFSAFQHFYSEQRKIIEASPILHHHKDSVLLYVARISCFRLLLPPSSSRCPNHCGCGFSSLGWGKRGLTALLGAYRPVRGNIGWQQAMRIYAIILAMLVAISTLSVVRVYLGESSVRAGENG